MKPSAGQLGLLILSIALFSAGGGVSLARLWNTGERLRIAAKALFYLALTCAASVLIWHSAGRGQWQPLRDNFEALLWLAVLIAIFVMYVQRAHPLAGLEWFLMPVVILLLIGAALFGRLQFHNYQPIVTSTWLWVHTVSAYGGAAAFAVAGAGGAMYVIASRRLRSKTRSSGPGLPSLERIERMMMLAVTLGFALLTVGLVTGLGRMMEGTQPPLSKLLPAVLAWLVYAVVMHAPINPRFRGRRAAMLSVLGFVLVFGTIIAVQFMPAGGAQ